MSGPDAERAERWTLLVAGVLALAGGQDIADRVGSSLDKALFWK